MKTVVYLNELGEISELSPGLGILRLIAEPANAIPDAARELIERIQRTSTLAAARAQLLELIETIVVYAFPCLSREEIATMLGLTDMRETRVYQEGREEGREEEAKSLILRLLNRQLEELSAELREQVSQLSLETLEALGEALFDFEEVADLQEWLAQQAIAEE